VRTLDASKKGQFRRKEAYSEINLLIITRKLYNLPDMQLRVSGQRKALLAVMETQHAEQMVVVLGTGSGKILISMIGASVTDARITILVLSIVVLRGDILRRCLLVGIRSLIWISGVKQSASLVMISAEAVCTSDFLDYVYTLVRRQVLDRIIIDESQLTITANDYRLCMSQLG
jgi:superfamily II DNA helicase RecQ